MSELSTVEGIEAVLLILGVGIALLVSLVKERRCKKSGQHWAFRPNGYTDDVGEDAREEWQCEHCGFREWKQRAARFQVGGGD